MRANHTQHSLSQVLIVFGKDGPKGRPELKVTAQVELTLKSCGKNVRVHIAVLVRPGSSQELLLGTNASPLLGLKLLDGIGHAASPNEL